MLKGLQCEGILTYKYDVHLHSIRIMYKLLTAHKVCTVAVHSLYKVQWHYNLLIMQCHYTHYAMYNGGILTTHRSDDA